MCGSSKFWYGCDGGGTVAVVLTVVVRSVVVARSKLVGDALTVLQPKTTVVLLVSSEDGSPPNIRSLPLSKLSLSVLFSTL